MAESGPVDLGIPGLMDAAAIGAGGFATVYRAYQPAFDRVVAVKMLEVGGMDAGGRARFERECRALGSISGHPGIVTVHDAGFNAAGRPYLIMAFVARGSIADRLDSVGRYGWEEAARVGVKLAAALETAHRAGIIHRDIKPANVLLSDFGEPLLSDFGIARIAGGPETRSGVITASFAHAAPEIVSGERPTERSDVYSLASTVYAMVAGRSPFARTEEEPLVSLVARIVSQPAPSLTTMGVPPHFAAVLERGLAKRAADRWGSALEFGQALRQVQIDAGIAPTDMPVGTTASASIPPAAPTAPASPSPSAATKTADAWATPVPPAPPGTEPAGPAAVEMPRAPKRRRRRWLWAAVVFILAGAVGTATAIVITDPFTSGSPQTTAAQATGTTAPPSITSAATTAPVTTVGEVATTPATTGSPPATATPVFVAASEAFAGTWEADDVDGSRMWLNIVPSGGGTELFAVSLYDSRIAVCGMPGLLEVTGRATTAATLDTVEGPVRCRDADGVYDDRGLSARISVRTLGVDHLIGFDGVLWERSDTDFADLR